MCENTLLYYEDARDGLCALCHLNLCLNKDHCARCDKMYDAVVKWVMGEIPDEEGQ